MIDKLIELAMERVHNMGGTVVVRHDDIRINVSYINDKITLDIISEN